MQILVIGKSYASIKLADYLAEDKKNIVFTNSASRIANNIQIHTDNLNELKDFIIANDVSLLILVDNLNYDLSIILNETECLVLACDFVTSRITTNISSGKKFAHKSKINTSKFIVFEKPAPAIEYLKEANLPVIIQNDYTPDKEVPYIADTKDKAKKQIELLFQRGARRIVTEDYVEGKIYTKYIISDGINIIDLFDTVTYFDEVSTNNTKYIDNDTKLEIEGNIIPNLIDSFMEDGVNLQGILGVSFVINKKNEIYFLKFESFIKDIDIDIFLNTVDFRLENMLYDAAAGSLVNEFIKFSSKYVLSVDIGSEIVSCSANTMNQAIELAKIESGEDKIIDEAIKRWQG